jgi:hypothetical protein
MPSIIRSSDQPYSVSRSSASLIEPSSLSFKPCRRRAPAAFLLNRRSISSPVPLLVSQPIQKSRYSLASEVGAWLLPTLALRRKKAKRYSPPQPTQRLVPGLLPLATRKEYAQAPEESARVTCPASRHRGQWAGVAGVAAGLAGRGRTLPGCRKPGWSSQLSLSRSSQAHHLNPAPGRPCGSGFQRLMKKSRMLASNRATAARMSRAATAERQWPAAAQTARKTTAATAARATRPARNRAR